MASNNNNIPVTTFPSHQLNNGLYVSGRPDQGHKERAPTMTSSAMPYTGGDIKKSGELGKMLDKRSGPLTGSSFRSNNAGTGASGRNSGPLPGMARQTSLNKSTQQHNRTASKTSGPLNLPATGLITSASPAGSRKMSGPISMAVNNLSHDETYGFRSRVPRAIVWTVIPLSLIGFIAGGFILAAVKNAVLLIVVACLFAAMLLLLAWNTWWGKTAIPAFVSGYPDAQLADAKDGQLVKVTGVVTCGGVPLESGYQRVNRCIYTSTSLYEYRGFKSKPANQEHQYFTWGRRHVERYIVDFYISDFQSGLRALVKAGYGSSVTPCVEESRILDVYPESTTVPSQFSRWLHERNLSRDERRMKLTEGYIKEGSTVTVLGMVQRNDNVVMLVPPSEPISTGCQFSHCLLPASPQGIIVTSAETCFKVDDVA